MPEIFDLFETDANNIAHWPEGMLGGQINNAGRADEGLLARWYRDTDGSRVASNVGNAFSVTSVRSIPALFNNLIMVFTANITITGPATLNLNGTGAKPIKRFNFSDMAVGDIIANQPVMVIYKQVSDVWLMTNAPAALVTNMFGDFSENVPVNPAANTARVYAKDDSSITLMAYRDSAGTETLILGPPARAYGESGFISTSAQIPADGTVPLVSEGTEAMSVSLTLRRASSRVRLRFCGVANIAQNESARVAIFRGSTCLAARNWSRQEDGGASDRSLVLETEDAPGSVGAHTYSVRVGTNGSTVDFLGNQSFGGVEKLTFVAEEVFVLP
jgi:hypothetical protein